jgi:hypothetical protein
MGHGGSAEYSGDPEDGTAAPFDADHPRSSAGARRGSPAFAAF